MGDPTEIAVNDFLEQPDSVKLKNIREILKHDTDPLRHSKAIWANGRMLTRPNGGGKYRNLADWVADFDEWQRADTPRQYDKPNFPSQLLRELWNAFSKRIEGALITHTRIARIFPTEGGILAFVERTRLCLICAFQISSGRAAKITPIELITGPQSLFDIWSDIDTLPKPSSQNFVKRMIASGHKIVFHRGILVHVDRRIDEGVFGPTIDTILAAEQVATLLSTDWANSVKTSMEVGCGNGLISAVLMYHASSLEHHIALDVDTASIVCTQRNISCEQADGAYAHASTPQVSLLVSRFGTLSFSNPIDLCVCNPPYIPLPPGNGGREADKVTRDNRRATGGTELMIELLKAAPQMLSKSGKLIVVTTHMAMAELEAAVPAGFSIRQMLPTPREVIFDVEAVVNDPQWLSYLIDHRELGQKRNHYFHKLHVVEISRSAHA